MCINKELDFFVIIFYLSSNNFFWQPVNLRPRACSDDRRLFLVGLLCSLFYSMYLRRIIFKSHAFLGIFLPVLLSL